MCGFNRRCRDRVELICECREVRFDRNRNNFNIFGDFDRNNRNRNRNDDFRCRCREINRRDFNFF